MTQQLLVGLLLGLIAVGIVFHLVSLIASLRYAREWPKPPSEWPAISVLKPVRGVDPEAYENYASFCRQDYPCYEILFGIQSASDPAAALVKRLQRDFPEVSIRLVISDERVGPNLKVCNLYNLQAHARHELLVISDSDMRVQPDYIRQVAAYFEDPQVGLVTSPYRGCGARTFAAGLETLGMATEFFPGVAIASQFVKPAFALGSTLALRRETLEAIGGWKEIAQYLADDFQMGYRVAALGQRVVLSRYVVDTFVPNAGFPAMFERRLRWMRTARTCQPTGFAGSAVTHSTVWALVLVALAGQHAWSWEILAFQQLVRMSTAWFIGYSVLQSRALKRWFWLLPVSDLLNFVLWIGSWCGNTVQWRGDRYRIVEGGKMVPVIWKPGYIRRWLYGRPHRS